MRPCTKEKSQFSYSKHFKVGSVVINPSRSPIYKTRSIAFTCYKFKDYVSLFVCRLLAYPHFISQQANKIPFFPFSIFSELWPWPWASQMTCQSPQFRASSTGCIRACMHCQATWTTIVSIPKKTQTQRTSSPREKSSRASSYSKPYRSESRSPCSWYRTQQQRAYL